MTVVSMVTSRNRVGHEGRFAWVSFDRVLTIEVFYTTFHDFHGRRLSKDSASRMLPLGDAIELGPGVAWWSS